MSIVEIPLQALSPEALIGVIDAFILREGTDYGDRVYTLDEKRDRVRRLLESKQGADSISPGKRVYRHCADLIFFVAFASGRLSGKVRFCALTYPFAVRFSASIRAAWGLTMGIEGLHFIFEDEH